MPFLLLKQIAQNAGHDGGIAENLKAGALWIDAQPGNSGLN